MAIRVNRKADYPTTPLTHTPDAWFYLRAIYNNLDYRGPPRFQTPAGVTNHSARRLPGSSSPGNSSVWLNVLAPGLGRGGSRHRTFGLASSLYHLPSLASRAGQIPTACQRLISGRAWASIARVYVSATCRCCE